MTEADMRYIDQAAELAAEKAVGKLRVEIGQINTDVSNNKTNIDINRKGIRRTMGINIFGWLGVLTIILTQVAVKWFAGRS